MPKKTDFLHTIQILPCRVLRIKDNVRHPTKPNTTNYIPPQQTTSEHDPKPNPAITVAP